jgi:hypothetical protein
MGTFTANRGGTFTPVPHATDANIIALFADAAGDIGKVLMFSWGGRGTTSTGYRTRWGRAITNGASTHTPLTPAKSNPNQVALCLVGSYATPAVLDADPVALYVTDWNVAGGGGNIILPFSGGWPVVGNSAPYATIACGNIAGADADKSSYGITWEE